MRRCNIPPASCVHRYTTPCCKDCHETACETRRQNDPARCKCWTDRAPAKPKDRATRLDAAEIIRLHDAGLLQREIAERLGCSRSGVSAVLKAKKNSACAK